jgi:hypothetical protein
MSIVAVVSIVAGFFCIGFAHAQVEKAATLCHDVRCDGRGKHRCHDLDCELHSSTVTANKSKKEA